jgi:DNA (cytosine-5)-methyltransferase 1
MRALSLFSGYGGIDLALEDYARPIMYCEIEKYCQGILLSRMDDGTLPFAPIWDDVTTLDGKKLRGLVNIIYGGFPCQDLSVAGKGAGLAGKRSGLFTEIIRLAQEASPTFIFLENVPAIRTRGSIQVQEALASIGYDSRWGVISASEVGANHRRERWFCLAIRRDSLSDTTCSDDRINHTRTGQGQVQQSGECSQQRDISDTYCSDLWKQSDRFSECEGATLSGVNGKEEHMAHAYVQGQCGEATASSEEALWRWTEATTTNGSVHEGADDLAHTSSTGLQELNTTTISDGQRYSAWRTATSRGHWETEPSAGRVVDGCPFRMDRIKALGNGVVPLQVKTAFEILIGM